MNRLILLFFATFLFLSGSCDNSTSSEEVSENISLPLEIGNSWTFRQIVTSYNDQQAETDTLDQEFVFKVTGDTVINNVRWFSIESEDPVSLSFLGGYYSNQEDGIHFSKSFSPENQKPDVTEGIPDLIYFSQKINTDESSDAISVVRPFFHNPDSEVPERLIQDGSWIGVTFYKGSDVLETGESVHNYVKNYYQTYTGNQYITVVPHDLEFSVSNELGFVVYECGYISSRGSTEQDPRFRPFSDVRFELIEFNRN